jgi:hypothetical protein
VRTLRTRSVCLDLITSASLRAVGQKIASARLRGRGGPLCCRKRIRSDAPPRSSVPAAAAAAPFVWLLCLLFDRFLQQTDHVHANRAIPLPPLTWLTHPSTLRPLDRANQLIEGDLLIDYIAYWMAGCLRTGFFDDTSFHGLSLCWAVSLQGQTVRGKESCLCICLYFFLLAREIDLETDGFSAETSLSIDVFFSVIACLVAFWMNVFACPSSLEQQDGCRCPAVHERGGTHRGGNGKNI